MGHSEAYTQSFFQNPSQWGVNPQPWGLVNLLQPQGSMGQQAWGQGLGQAAFGQAGFYGAPYGQSGLGGWGSGWGPQRQLSNQDIGEVVRQLLPLLPQVVAHAQHQPQAAFGFGPYGQQGFYGPRVLSQQDVQEVVRQILPVIPQIVGLLQGQQGPYMPHAAAMYGGYGGYGAQAGGGYGQPWQMMGQHGYGSSPFGINPAGQWGQSPWGQSPWGLGQQPFGHFGSAAFGGGQGWGQPYQRQLNQADVSEVVRQLTAVIPQVIANLQAVNQQQQRAV